MNARARYFAAAVVFTALVSLAAIHPAFAQAAAPKTATPITIEGTITDHGKPVQGLIVVAWCGSLDLFGGWDTTNAKGWFEIHTNSADCPMLAAGFLEIFHPGDAVGFAFADFTVHTLSVVNVKLEVSHPVPVPEFDLANMAVALIAGAAAVAFARHWRRVG